MSSNKYTVEQTTINRYHVIRTTADGRTEVVETYDNFAHADALAYTLNNFNHGES